MIFWRRVGFGEWIVSRWQLGGRWCDGKYSWDLEVANLQGMFVSRTPTSARFQITLPVVFSETLVSWSLFESEFPRDCPTIKWSIWISSPPYASGQQSSRTRLEATKQYMSTSKWARTLSNRHSHLIFAGESGFAARLPLLLEDSDSDYPIPA